MSQHAFRSCLVAGTTLCLCVCMMAGAVRAKPENDPDTAAGESLSARLAALGITYRGFVAGGVFTTASGGVDTGRVGAGGQFISNFDFDMGRLVGWDDTHINTEIGYFPFNYPDTEGAFFSAYAGSYLGGDQYPPHDRDAVPWLSMLTVSHSWMNDRFSLEFGKTNLQRRFFANVCGIDLLCADPLVKWDSTLPDASVGSLALIGTYRDPSGLDYQLGVQQLRDYTALISDHGWNALSTDGGVGTMTMAAVGRGFAPGAPMGEAVWSLTGWYANTEVTDSATGASHTGSSGVLFKGRTALLASPSWMAADRGLALFGSLGRDFDDAQPIGWTASLGVSLVNPSIASADWSLAQSSLKIVYARINASTLEAQRVQRVSLGGEDVLTAPDQWRLSWDTTIQVNRYVILEPSVQYIVNPDSSQSSGNAATPRDGFIVGVMAGLSF